MKRIIIILLLFCTPVFSQNINWYADGDVYTTTTCEDGADIILPQTPTKKGYAFKGWKFVTPIEYLESTGTQYIDTGYIPNGGTRMEIQFKIVRLQTNLAAGAVPIGGRKAFRNKHFNIFAPVNSADENDICVGNECGSFSFEPLNKRIRGIIDVPNKYIELSYDDVVNSSNINISNVIYEYPLFLFALNTSGNVGMSDSHIRIFGVQITEDGNLVRDFIPVLNENGVACMFDKVTDQFFYNAGTGQFIAGPVVETNL